MENYKEYSKEEEEIYDKEIKKLLKMVNDGLSYEDACKTINLDTPEMKRLIAEDLLKILIAELHYSKGISLEQIAQKLQIPVSQIRDTHRMMIEDVMNTVNKGFDPSRDILH